MLFVEIPEEGIPGFPGIILTRKLHYRLRDHTVGPCLVVPSVVHPQSGLSVPTCHTRRMNPCHTCRMDSPALSYRLVGPDKEFRCLPVVLAKEEAVAVDGLAEQLNGGRGAEIGILP